MYNNVKQLPLYEAYCILRRANAIEIDGMIMKPLVLDYEDDPENEFLILQWDEEYKDELLTVEVAFKEKDNEMVEVHDKKLVLINTVGETEELTLFRVMDLLSLK